MATIFSVIGANGKTGRRVLTNLTNLGHQVRAGSRTGDPAFDWTDPSTFTSFLEGTQRVYVTYYPDLAVPGAREAIRALTEAARRVGLEKLVLLSGKGEKEAEACERIVAESGLAYTLVRASWFNQNFSESFLLDPVKVGQVALPMAQAKIPFVDTEDIAAVATAALTDDRLNGRTLTVTGPEQITFAEAVATIARATGRRIDFQPISLEEYGHILRTVGLPPDYVWLIEYLFREVLGNPENQAIAHDIEEILGRRPITFAEYAAKTVPTGIWAPVTD